MPPLTFFNLSHCETSKVNFWRALAEVIYTTKYILFYLYVISNSLTHKEEMQLNIILVGCDHLINHSVNLFDNL